MSQRNVELLIGRLLTDEEMRRQFLLKPGGAIEDFCRWFSSSRFFLHGLVFPPFYFALVNLPAPGAGFSSVNLNELFEAPEIGVDPEAH